MDGRRYTAVLNPFCREAKEIVKNAPPFDSLPKSVIKRAIARIKHTSGPEARVDFSEELIREEVLSFYLMCQSVAAVSYPYSSETKAIVDSTQDTIKYRLYDLFRRGRENSCLDLIRRSLKFRKMEGGDSTKLGSLTIPKEDLLKLRDLALEENGIKINGQVMDDRIISRYIPRYAVRWTDLGSLIKHRRVDLMKQYVIKGWALITPKELWEFFAGIVGGEMVDYLSSLYDQFSERSPPSPLLEEVGEQISDALPKEMTQKEGVRMAPGELRHNCYPPCIKKILAGVGFGNRNYAIIVLLSSFLSYARVSPSGKAIRRIADFVDNISMVKDDVIPLIFDAAERCNPPLFQDQPQDKPNVYYHMGFGMTTEPRLRDSGKSKWYRPPNCRKVKTEAPSLCNPDNLCSGIENPLTYYYKKISETA